MAGTGGRRVPDDPLFERMDLGQVRTRADLTALLEQRRATSNLTYRALARDSENPLSSVRDWCQGRFLPARGQDQRFRQLLVVLGFAGDEVEALMDRVVQLRGRGASRLAPYPGMDSYGRDDAEWFFGRNELVAEAADHFRSTVERPGEPRLLWVVGASGAGKSSLLHAGLCPMFETLGLQVATMTPGEKPTSRLVRVVAEHSDLDPAAVEQGLFGDAGPEEWAATVGATAQGAVRLVVIIDQFEELYQAGDDPAEQERFVAALAALVAPTSTVGCAVVAGLRADFYGAVTSSPQLAWTLPEAQVVVSPMSRLQLRAAIEQPATRAGFAIEDDLVEVLLDDFVPRGALGGQHDVGALPLLAHALRMTWDRARHREMTLRDYAGSGGIGGAIEGTAQQIFDELDEAGQDLVRQVFLRLIHVEADAVATRRVARLSELRTLEGAVSPGSEGDGDEPATSGDLARAEVTAIIERFVDVRLLTATESTVAITHESLLSAWSRLTAWIDEDREAFGMHRAITEATRVWEEADRDPDQLARGVRLEAMQTWAASARPRMQLNQNEQEFVAASYRAAVAAGTAQRRQTRRLRTRFAAALVAALVASGLAVGFNRARHDTAVARDEALSREIAVKAEHLRATDPTLAAQLALAGYETSETTEARSALLGASAVAASTRYLGGEGSTALGVSPRGGLVGVSNSDDGTVQLFTRSGDQPDRLRRAGMIDLDGPDLEIYALALTPDDHTLVVGDAHAGITLWDVVYPDNPKRLPVELEGPTGPIQALAIDPAGTELAATGEGEGVFRWDIGDPSDPRELALLPAPDVTWGVAYHPDGGLLAVGLETGEVQLWDLADSNAPRRSGVARANDGSIFDVAFSPDGRFLAAGSRGGTLQVWNVSSSSAPQPVEVADGLFDSWVNTVAYSPDGAYLAAGSSDLSLRIWDTDSWSVLQILPHPAALTQAVFTNDGAALLTAAVDGTTRVWDLPESIPVQVTGRIWGLAYTADGDRFAAFSGEESRIWDVSDPHGRALTRLGIPEGSNDELSGGSAMSTDGSLLALGTRNGPVYLVDVTNSDHPTLVADPLGGGVGRLSSVVETVAFSPDGTLLAAGGQDTDIRIWDITDPAHPELASLIEEPVEGVLNLNWSPTDPYLAAASADNHVYLYDMSDPTYPQQLAQLGGFDSEAYAAAFSPNGDLLATGGSDTVVVLWDIGDPRHPRRLGKPIRGPVGRVFDLEFSPNGEQLAGAIVDGTAWVWDVADPEQPERRAVLGPVGTPLSVVAFSPDGETLVAGAADGQVRRWSLDDTAVAELTCATVGDPITADEWATHLPNTPYTSPCPG